MRGRVTGSRRDPIRGQKDPSLHFLSKHHFCAAIPEESDATDESVLVATGHLTGYRCTEDFPGIANAAAMTVDYSTIAFREDDETSPAGPAAASVEPSTVATVELPDTPLSAYMPESDF